MLDCHRVDRSLSELTVLRRWIARETDKDEYPDADPTAWDRDRLTRELEATFEEPVPAATRGDPTWLSVTLPAAEVGKLAVFPGPGWEALSTDGTVSGVVDRLRSADLADEFPQATAKIDALRDDPPADGFGALLARQDGQWPPVLSTEITERVRATGWPELPSRSR